MIRVNLKPLSVNQAWKGRRMKTAKYKQFEHDVLWLLPKSKVQIPKGDMAIAIRFGFSNMDADIDNPIKLLLDILQKKYEFNDNRIMRLSVEKCRAEKGFEYFEFEVKPA